MGNEEMEKVRIFIFLYSLNLKGEKRQASSWRLRKDEREVFFEDEKD